MNQHTVNQCNNNQIIRSEKNLIVFVEDNIDYADLVREFIEENSQFKIIHFKCPKNALKYLETEAPLVCGIISDLLMKEMDGFDFLDHLKNFKNLKHIPCIIVSGTQQAIFDDMLKSKNYSAFLEKPVALDKLLTAVEYYFLKGK